jgi:AmmeMemoRadiSam system protein A
VNGEAPAGPPELGEEERRQLLDVARRAIAARLSSTDFREPEVGRALRRPGAAFVTLRRRDVDELRGCIGTLEPREALVTAVARMAVAAATHDLRFPPVRAEELPFLAVEISVLRAPAPIAPDRIQPGLHGLIVRHRGRSGLLLPQVATDHGWDRETFLQYTCRKAGLPPDAWRDPESVLLCFTAIVFSED